MEFFIAPSKGGTLDRQMAKGEMEIGGIPLSDFPNLPEVISAPQSEAPGGYEAPVEVKIDNSDLAYLKGCGASPATSTSRQGKNSGVAYGSLFALTFWGYLNENAVVSPNNVTAWVVSDIQNSSYSTEKSTLNVMRSSPIKGETHFIKNGYYQTGKLSGWGVSGEGTHETLQVSITMPTEKEISAYKRMVIEVEPEKGGERYELGSMHPGRK